MLDPAGNAGLTCAPSQSSTQQEVVDSVSDEVRVRIAPSPTGHLHVGTARSALYNYLYARRHHGKFILRLEDTDDLRSREVYTKDIIDGLRWLSLEWDEGPDIGGPYEPYRQTEKIDHYSQVAHQLIANGSAYFCYCTSDELARLKQNNANQSARYDNRCRHLTAEKVEHLQAEGRVPAIRFKVDEPRVISWHDRVKGEISIDSADLGGDLIIVKSNGMAVYNFAVVVDDVDMKITDVIRGEDHIHNTAKQLLIYEALGKTPPSFAHVALIFDIERRKLSKRFHGEAVHVDKYRQDGYMPEAMVNYLAQMSWTHPEGTEIFSLEEACAKFDLDKVSKSPAVFDVQRLNWFNSHYIRSLPLDVVRERAMEYLAQYDLSSYDNAALNNIVACVRDGLTVLSEIAAATRFFFVDKVEISSELQNSLLNKASARSVLTALLAQLPGLPWGEKVGLKASVDAIGSELGLKGKDLYWPIRAALSGSTQGPDLGSMLSALGESKVRSRLEAALKLCAQV